MNKKLLILIGFLTIFFIVAGWSVLVQAETDEKLSQVKVAVLYENITDGVTIGRSVAETIKLLKDTRAEMIFRGFWKWEPIVESPDDFPEGLFEFTKGKGFTNKQAIEKTRQTGRYYQSLFSWISAIKKDMPDIIFCGGIPAQQLCRIELDPITGKVYTADETWAMALDPQKWDITRKGKSVTKEQFQARVAGRKPGKNGAQYDRRKASAYFPDITNPDFQQLLLSWAKRQIDCGVDAIWIDMLYAQAKLMARAIQDPEDPAVQESLTAAVKIIDGIHEYGESKGKHIYVGTWGHSKSEFGTQYAPAKLDFVTFTPSKEEISNNRVDDQEWNSRIDGVRRIYGDIPIFAFIDWSNNDTPTTTFSQELSASEQAQVLKTVDADFARLGINFIYPLHGGFMGQAATRLSFGKQRVYDSLAPEFQTYETIKELAQAK